MKARQPPKTCFYLTLRIKRGFSSELSPMTCTLVRTYTAVEFHSRLCPSFPSAPPRLSSTPSYLLSWPPHSSPWSSCGRQQPGQWAAPADTRPGQRLPTEPPGGTRCSDLKQRAEGEEREKERERESLIIHSCSSKIEAQLSPLHPSPLFHHLTIQLLRVRLRQVKKNLKNWIILDCRTAKAQHDDTDDDYCHHHHHHHHRHLQPSSPAFLPHHRRIKFDFQRGLSKETPNGRETPSLCVKGAGASLLVSN